MLEGLRWYLALTAVAAGGVLPSLVLFGRLRSGGVLYARPLAVALVAYGAWTASALGVAPYGTGLVIAAAAALWAWSALLAARRPRLLSELWRRRAVVLAGELLFVALFALIAMVRAQAPAAQYTEKPMDLMVLTAVHRATELPPLDPWFAGERIAYYHLGHTAVDVVARLAGVSVGVAFTLGVATAGAMAGAAVFALAGDVIAIGGRARRGAPWVAGGVAAASLLALSTLVGPVELLAANGVGGEAAWGWIGVPGLPGPASATHGVPDQFFWWWRATRVLPDTITEFPAFSLILGDLHAHLLGLALAPPALALALIAFEGATPPTWRVWLRRPGALALAALLYAALAMTHSWDAVLYGAIWFGAVAAAFAAAGWPPLPAALGAARHLTPPVALALIAAAPFLVTVEGSRALDLVTGGGSDPLRFVFVWLPLALPLGAAALVLRPRVAKGAALRGVLMASLLPLGWALAALLGGRGGALAERGAGWAVLAALVLAAGVAGAAAAGALGRRERGRAAWLALASAVAAVVLATELVFVNDILGYRLNTVFKLWFGLWLVLAVAGGAAVADALGELRARRPGALALAALAAGALVYGASLLYAPAAAVSRAREGQQRGLDALAFLERADAGQAAALRWVSANLTPSDTLLEAVGEVYSAGNFLSAASAVPTLLGWPQHQQQWRGREAEIAERRRVVARIYGEGATEEVKALTARYGVTYIYLGREERRQFGADVADRFAAWPAVFDAPGAGIVAVPR